MVREQNGLIYGLDDVPRLIPLAMLGLQHFMLNVPNLAIVVLICRVAGVDAATAESVLSFSLMALGAATLLQCSGRFGSGYFITSCSSGIYLSASLSAAAGGLPLVCGMTLLAGLFQVFFAGLFVRVRRFFPNEIVALAIIIVGIELGAIGLNRLAASGTPGLLAGGTTLLVSVIFGVYGKGGSRLYCALLGMVSGYLLCLFFGLVGPHAANHASSSEHFGLPSVAHLGLEFDIDYLLPFSLAAIGASLKTMGAVITSARINDPAWVRPDMPTVKRGVIADGLSTTLSALLGSVGTNSSTSSVGVSQASGATSRAIGLSVAAWMFLFALSPAFTQVLVSLPDPVVGGALVFAGCLVMANGFQVLGTVQMDMRRAGVVAFPLMLAIACIADAPLFAQLPESLRPLVSSALAVGVLAALVVNAFLSLGSLRRTLIFLDPQRSVGERMSQVRDVLDEWHVAHNVKVRLMLILRELLDERGCNLKLGFDGCTLHVDLTRADTTSDTATLSSGRFFTDRVSDAISYRKDSNGTSLISASFEQ
ncbi:MAG: solute carrier family 23 protein [Azoarcus sp.]|nr:solute carrier family 23 protein [Azoarcus sp.]